MIEIILEGIFIGLSISVPLGPIGMLCVQRTFDRGRKYGFITGLGATASDLVYVVISLFFLSFVVDIINDNLFVFQLAGSFIVCIFGFFIFKSHPNMQPKPNETAHHSLLGDFATSFGLTFSNPLILFVLIALFSRIDFITDATTLFQKLTGIASIALGAVLWWTTLTYFVNKLRGKINVRGLRLINLITGSIIIILGVAGLVSSFYA
ncbi:MAG: LysE family translocator [Prevotellaceae bacterium]|jgi:threonine/homoserine/homoserine lactone efflux protein|nr:LysE family translocator [Prevotellaceae bacterium]